MRRTYYLDTEVMTMTHKPGQADPVREWHPLVYTFGSTDEDWYDHKTAKGRQIIGADRKFGFPTPAEKAEWERLGRPKLRGRVGRAPRDLVPGGAGPTRRRARRRTPGHRYVKRPVAATADSSAARASTDGHHRK